MECPKCGKNNKPDAAVCSNCYYDLQSKKTPVKTEVTVKPQKTSQTLSQETPKHMRQPSVISDSSANTLQSDIDQAPFQGPAAFLHVPVYEYVGFWTRASAYIIDSILLIAVLLIIGIAQGPVPPDEARQLIEKFGSSGYAAFPGMSDEMIGWIMRFNTLDNTLLVIAFLYNVGMNAGLGATLGKMAVKIKIIKKDGAKLGLGNAIIRFIIENFVFVIAVLFVPFTEKKQGLHDMAAGTVVVRR